MKILTLLCIVLSFGCSGTEGSKPSAKKSVKKKAEKPNPTHFLTLEMVASHFGVDVSKVTLKHREGNQYCSYIWDKENAEEISKKNAEMIMEKMKKKLAGEEVDMKMPSTSNTVFFHFYRTFDSELEAANGFNGMLTRLKKGMTVENKGTAHTFKVDYDQEVEGVGDQAAWASTMNQLSFQTGPHMIHLKVDISEDGKENLAQAKQLAAKVIAKL